jgi:hypothetical protein
MRRTPVFASVEAWPRVTMSRSENIIGRSIEVCSTVSVSVFATTTRFWSLGRAARVGGEPARSLLAHLGRGVDRPAHLVADERLAFLLLREDLVGVPAAFALVAGRPGVGLRIGRRRSGDGEQSDRDPAGRCVGWACAEAREILPREPFGRIESLAYRGTVTYLRESLILPPTPAPRSNRPFHHFMSVGEVGPIGTPGPTSTPRTASGIEHHLGTFPRPRGDPEGDRRSDGAVAARCTFRRVAARSTATGSSTTRGRCSRPPAGSTRGSASAAVSVMSTRATVLCRLQEDSTTRARPRWCSSAGLPMAESFPAARLVAPERISTRSGRVGRARRHRQAALVRRGEPLAARAHDRGWRADRARGRRARRRAGALLRPCARRRRAVKPQARFAGVRS